jgi:hypothetical protein
VLQFELPAVQHMQHQPLAPQRVIISYNGASDGFDGYPTFQIAFAIKNLGGIHLTKQKHGVCWGMPEYPKTIEEFEAMFPTDEACRNYLCQIRWPNGFCWPRGGGVLSVNRTKAVKSGYLLRATHPMD